ncbi:MAG TPA: hypothetical protein VF226_17140 [Hyphomicrobiaceae bacterium]
MNAQQLINRLEQIEITVAQPDERRVISEARQTLMSAVQQVEHAEGAEARAERRQRMGGNVFGATGRVSAEDARAHLRSCMDDALRVARTWGHEIA